VTIISAPPLSGVPRRSQPARVPRDLARSRMTEETIVVGLFIAATAALLAGLGGRAASLAYVAVSALAGAALLARSPVSYSCFCLWLWFVTPFVRRVLDYRHGWNPTNPALLAPPLVAALAIVTLARHARELRGRLFAPYLLILGALGYGYAVGMINAGLVPASYALLTWIAPLVFGLHMALSWRLYAELNVAIRKTFMVALPVLALYGLYQFLRLPRWDAAWMINADLKSIGSPLPLLVRVFGTLNTPGPYAAFLCAGMLMMLTGTGFVRFPGIAVAFISMLLTRTRAVWVAFLIGLLVQQFSMPVVRLPRRVVTLVVVAVLSLPLTTIPAFRSTILPRLNTLTNISQDNSFIKRVQFSQENASEIVQTAEGNGLGTTGGAIKLGTSANSVRSLDNGFLELFYLFGWPGGTMFLLGIATLLIQSFRFAEARRDPFASATRATAIALVSILPIGDVFTGPTGTLLWTMLGLGIAAHAHHLTTGLALRSRAARGYIEGRARALAGYGVR
jgi:hypothetical protein